MVCESGFLGEISEKSPPILREAEKPDSAIASTENSALGSLSLSFSRSLSPSFSLSLSLFRSCVVHTRAVKSTGAPLSR